MIRFLIEGKKKKKIVEKVKKKKMLVTSISTFAMFSHNAFEIIFPKVV